jgi:adenylate cyclase
MRRRDWLTALLIALLIGGGVSLFADRLSGASLDFLFWLRERVAPAQQLQPSPLAIIAIDEETYRRAPFINVPNALWTHEIASVLDALVDADAKAVGFDAIFPTSMDRYVPGFDRPFLTALQHAAAAGKIVLGETELQQTPIVPFPGQSFAVGGDKNVRLLNLSTDDDGVIRRAPLYFVLDSSTDAAGRLETSFALELAARTVGSAPVHAADESVTLGAYVVPNAGTRQFQLNFHALDRIPSYSLADLVACAAAGKADFFHAHFAGKTALIGAVLDVEDRKLTSMRLATRPERGATGERCALPPLPGLFRENFTRDTIPGIYVLATAIDNLVAGDALTSVSRAALSAIIVSATLLAGLVGLLLRSIPAGAVMAGAALAWAVAATMAFRAGLVLPLLAPPLAAGLSLALLVGYRFSVADRDKRLLRRGFGFYLAPTLIDRMMAAEKLPELGGETRRVTILMSDLAGFTTLSEPLPPRELVAIVNAYFTAMSDIIEEEGGFIQDYAGDAVLAIFGAPLEDADHALHATRAALRCRDRLTALAGEDAPLHGHALHMRIGLNTGEVLVGNIGSTRRLKYTAMGDAVNLAARLETANKSYGTTILASGTTRDADPAFAWREIDRVRVVGREQPVELWEPLGPADQVPPVVAAAAAAYAEALSAYRGGDFPRALNLFTALQSADPAALAMAKRLMDTAVTPPGWDGVSVLTMK